MNNKDFNEIEQAIMNWFVANANNPVLAENLASASVTGREVTSCGFFTNFACKSHVQPTGGSSSISGCGLFAPELEFYADCILHLRSDIPSSLEVYAIGSGHPLKISIHEVRAIKENFVDLR